MIEVIISHGLSVRMKIMIIFQLLTKFPLSQQNVIYLNTICVTVTLLVIDPVKLATSHASIS